jgi:hypothetical protein
MITVKKIFSAQILPVDRDPKIGYILYPKCYFKNRTLVLGLINV